MTAEQIRRPSAALQNYLETAILSFDTRLVSEALAAGADPEAQASSRLEHRLSATWTRPLTIIGRVFVTRSVDFTQGFRIPGDALWLDVRSALVEGYYAHGAAGLPKGYPDEVYTGAPCANTALDALMERLCAPTAGAAAALPHSALTADLVEVLGLFNATARPDVHGAVDAFCARLLKDCGTPAQPAVGLDSARYTVFRSHVAGRGGISDALAASLRELAARTPAAEAFLMHAAVTDAILGTETTMVERLLAAGIGADGRDSLGRTPLMLAARQVKCDLIETLLRAGADWRLADASGADVQRHLDEVERAYASPAGVSVAEKAQLCKTLIQSWAARHALTVAAALA